MNIEFQCPFCGQKLEAAEDRVGSQAQCPSCKHDIIISTISTSSPNTDFASIRKRDKIFLFGDKNYYCQGQDKKAYPDDNKNQQQQVKNFTSDYNDPQQTRVKNKKKSYKVKCSCCGRGLITGENWDGTQVQCPYCDKYVTVIETQEKNVFTGDNNRRQQQDKKIFTGDNKNIRQQDKKIFTCHNNDLGTGDVRVTLLPVWIVIFLIIAGIFSSMFSCDSSKSPSHNTTQSPSHNTTQSVKQSSSTWMDDNDPIKWRKEEEKLERGSGLSNAKYACRRCGMKSHYSLDDGVNGLGGVCMYCLNYMVERKKQGLPIR